MTILTFHQKTLTKPIETPFSFFIVCQFRSLVIARFVIISILSKELGVNLGDFIHTAEVKGYVYRIINGQKYEFPALLGK